MRKEGITLFFTKLAITNIRKNSKTFLPYLLACTFTVAIFFILRSVSIQPELADMAGGRSLKLLLSATVYIAAFFSVIFIFYTNSFLMKQRKKEFGLYNILGMEKRN